MPLGYHQLGAAKTSLQVTSDKWVKELRFCFKRFRRAVWHTTTADRKKCINYMQMCHQEHSTRARSDGKPIAL